MINLIAFLLLISPLQSKEVRRKIAVIDTGITFTTEIEPKLCEDYTDYTGTGIIDTHGHGTNIANIISKGLPSTYCIKVLKYFSTGHSPYENYDSYLSALREAVNDPDVTEINLSLGGNSPNMLEKALIFIGLTRGKIFSVAAGNNSSDLTEHCNFYPACYEFSNRNFHVVGNGTSDINKEPSSNYGKRVTNWEPGKNICAGVLFDKPICMTGTSQSTAIFTRRVLNER